MVNKTPAILTSDHILAMAVYMTLLYGIEDRIDAQNLFRRHAELQWEIMVARGNPPSHHENKEDYVQASLEIFQRHLDTCPNHGNNNTKCVDDILENPPEFQ